ncbi:MAG: RimK family alpha-L-glutamate ligase [Candidatus Methanomethylophilaceae archaeon]|nr:RimK family alpha-L-glutamate ligase [Candidatus Methanomethylophilaceae archaeon]
MKGLILINAYSRMRAFDVQASRLAEEFAELGIETDILRNDGFIARIEGRGIVADCDGYAFCVYLDKDKYVLEALERSGVPVFNRYSAIEACDDKMVTYIRLAGHNVRMPKTLPGLLCYDPGEPVRPEAAGKVADALGFPVVVKECYGSMGKGVHIARDADQLSGLMEKVKTVPHVFQEFVGSSSGRDLRVIVIGGKAIGGMLRHSDADFRSNIGCGGVGEPYDLTPEVAAYAERIADALDLDYCGIDLLFPGDGGDMILCEVNSNAFFEAFESCTGINVARIYAKHVLDEVIQLNFDARRRNFVTYF